MYSRSASPDSRGSSPYSVYSSEIASEESAHPNRPFRALVVHGPNATAQFEAAFPSQYDRCKQAMLIEQRGTRHTETFPYTINLVDYEFKVNPEFCDFVRQFSPSEFRKDHWWYDVSDMYDYDYSETTQPGSVSSTQPLTPPITASASPPGLILPSDDDYCDDDVVLVGEGVMFDPPPFSLDKIIPQPGLLRPFDSR